MNKRVFYLIILLLGVVTIFSMKMYFNLKNEALNENNYIVLLEDKLKKVSVLKEKYKFNSYLFNSLKKECSITDKEDAYFIRCSNLSSVKFNKIQTILFRNNFKIEKFKIYKNKLATIEAEISK